MITRKTEDKLVAAFKLLKRYGFSVYVPGCYDILHKDALIQFARSKEDFYRSKGGEE